MVPAAGTALAPRGVLAKIWLAGNPLRLLRGVREHRELLWQVFWRELQGRYRGSYLGILWGFVAPLATLGVYVIVFGRIFRVRWDQSSGGIADFGVTLFAGMTAFSLFSDVVARAPTMIVSHPNYVRKVVFPLEILPMSSLASALVHSVISVAIVVGSWFLATGTLHATVLYLPLVYVPLVCLTLGVGWFLAALGVFVRDFGHAVGVVLHMLFFLTPIVYPLSAVPAGLQPILRLNPLTFIVEDFRRILLWGLPPNWTWLLVGGLACLAIMLAGYAWFMVLRPAFADVI